MKVLASAGQRPVDNEQRTRGVMSQPIYARVRQNANYQILVKRRGRLAAILSAVVLVSYYSFMMVVAFAPSLLSRPLGDELTLSARCVAGGAVTIGFGSCTGRVLPAR